jgi:hypothetical protein
MWLSRLEFNVGVNSTWKGWQPQRIREVEIKSSGNDFVLMMGLLLPYLNMDTDVNSIDKALSGCRYGN